MRIVPSEGRTSPLIKLNSVVLPAPFGPIRATISPSPTPKLTPLRTRRPPKRLPTSVPSRRIGPMGSPFRSQGRGGCQRTPPRLRRAPPAPPGPPLAAAGRGGAGGVRQAFPRPARPHVPAPDQPLPGRADPVRRRIGGGGLRGGGRG